MTTMTVAQALMTFLTRQYTVDGDTRVRTIAGTFGIFGHGNVAGIGQALRQLHHDEPGAMPYHQARNEQAMVHQSVGYARMNRRLSTFASAASVGPGAANMLTGAALATSNRMPALLLPSDTFATRVADPVLQQLEHPHDTSLQVTDAFRPLSRFFDRVDRPEQLFSIALAAMRVLTDPAETGAVTIALPEDVQAETIEVPGEFLTERDWHLRRPLPETGPLERAVAAIRESRTPLIVAGGGVLYSHAEDELRAFAEATGIPVATTQAGGGVLDWDHPLNLGGIGATGSTAANRIAADTDLVIGIGTRYSDFTTASRTVFQNPEVRFVNLNVAAFDAFKHGSRLPLVADAREGIRGLHEHLGEFRVSEDLSARVDRERTDWIAVVDEATAPTDAALPGQAEVIGAVNTAAGPRDVVIQAAGSLPGDLQKLWRTNDPLGYHVEYAFSCMGYEIAGGLGVRRAIDAAGEDREAIVMVGDGSYLMLHTELVTAVAEGLKLIVVLIQNHGFASIGHLSETVGAPRFGTWYRKYDAEASDFRTDEVLPVDLAANARSYGIDVVEIDPGPDASTRLAEAVAGAKEAETSTLIHIHSDPLVYAPDGEGWWDVPVAEVSTMGDTQAARDEYEIAVKKQRPLL
ncbi:3D-(3,5/4)-trihydroxycyclohexane-1,2-dione acylhydrolase (decyclizing) [Brevibacterium casei]|uniref:3D-(3,5/4)-trihydroxycyclohexane-1,2-dione acylhydrolase (Decyclizing) n=1 Tax=Brevibacterium casei TaxID=33889 RepID=A0A269ZBS3_9MICO|nr:3D-(3,5/4)-trihydroxycyclohexane-1,2-dione acylhydrolase (decyclizing) [Brevibacterium casei]MCT1549422.1 3D-(3,5/4)-trihydroxycyclohexane-1,2-dione acylhydrolase (decyclizing) [Brevibacterium casei]MCT1560406.1 3D-(3,5/4)-trihydroxycyclohexane-1,2-dione acylhydrolase (decyclizing) [Brevibacterium casei]MCT2206722.1 3D-(3,5/4)-trihydroxycyclohexane-1,2-dione acylhydrolase (decyclizing) [Brevibacterium casei]PAK95109.1 3D-(3,5/4)-trihydroxycyclohexane-1,2-dione acylhydrolase (decyclizing) [Br